MERFQELIGGHPLASAVAGIVALVWVLSLLRRLVLRTSLSPVRRALTDLPVAGESAVSEMTSGGGSDDHLTLRLRLDEALVLIKHFFDDPRFWLAQIQRVSIDPYRVPCDNTWNADGNRLIVRHRTRVGPMVDVEVIQLMRERQSTFIARLESDCRDWYVDAYRRYPDLRRAISGLFGERERDVL